MLELELLGHFASSETATTRKENWELKQLATVILAVAATVILVNATRAAMELSTLAFPQEEGLGKKKKRLLNEYEQ